MKCIVYNYKNASNLEKLFFPKIHKRISNVPGWPVISNCGTTLQKELPIFYIARCKAVGHISMIQGISHRKLKE